MKISTYIIVIQYGAGYVHIGGTYENRAEAIRVAKASQDVHDRRYKGGEKVEVHVFKKENEDG